MTAQPVYKGYYDHHIDTYLITDVSSKAQASAMHVNYSAELKAVKGLPEQYFVRGRAAKGQLTIFASEPGKSNYNPLWEEVWVTWKKGVKPVLIAKDDQIDTLKKQGKVTEKDAHIVLNAPILTVGKGGLSRPWKEAEAAGMPAASKLRRRVVAVSPERESRKSSRALATMGLPLWGICDERRRYGRAAGSRDSCVFRADSRSCSRR